MAACGSLWQLVATCQCGQHARYYRGVHWYTGVNAQNASIYPGITRVMIFCQKMVKIVKLSKIVHFIVQTVKKMVNMVKNCNNGQELVTTCDNL